MFATLDGKSQGICFAGNLTNKKKKTFGRIRADIWIIPCYRVVCSAILNPRARTLILGFMDAGCQSASRMEYREFVFAFYSTTDFGGIWNIHLKPFSTYLKRSVFARQHRWCHTDL